jgi:CDP-glycerol glycerophosphotransferase (TagB/SpsB family)
MSHGVADKNYTLRRDKSSRLEINKFHLVAVPGPWMKRKLIQHPEIELKPDQIIIVGWPRLDALLAAANKKKKLPSRRRNVLWAPTHNSEPKMSSYPFFSQYTDVLANYFDYSISLHPSVRAGGLPTFDALLEADVVISDSGTLVYEAWAMGKPVIFPDWLIEQDSVALLSYERSAEAEIFKSGIGLHARNIDQVVEMAHSAHVLDQKSQAFIRDYIDPSTCGQSYRLLSEAVKKVWYSEKLKLSGF